MKSILVTGGSGYIGYALVKRLLIEGFDIHLVLRDSSKFSLFEEIKHRITIFQYDGTTENLCSIFRDSTPDSVVHLASYYVAEHQNCDIVSMINSNLLFSTQLLEASSKSGVKYFINTGTHWQHYNNDVYNPVCLYAATKQAFEAIAKYYLEVFNIRILTIKLLDTYGPFDPRPKVISLFKRIALSGEALDMSPGNQELGLLYVDDVITAFIKSLGIVKQMRPGESKSFIAAPPKIYTLKEVAEVFEKASDKTLNIRWGTKSYRQREMMKVWTGEDNILKDTETLDLYDGIRKMLIIEKLAEEDKDEGK